MIKKLLLVAALVFGVIFVVSVAYADGKLRKSEVQDHSSKSQTFKKKFGPFVIGKERIVVLYMYKMNQEKDHIETSVEIKNEAGLSFYKEFTQGADLERAAKLEGKSGEGLILYFDTPGDAPPADKSFQILGMENATFKPLSPIINFEGIMEQLPAGRSKGSEKLFDGDTTRIGIIWKGFFGVVIPLVVDFKKMRIAPLMAKGVFNINIGYTPNGPYANDVPIALYLDHNSNSHFKQITYVTRVIFINVYAEVHLKEGQIVNGMRGEIQLSNIWLHVKVNGIEGWLNDEETFGKLGLIPMG